MATKPPFENIILNKIFLQAARMALTAKKKKSKKNTF